MKKKIMIIDDDHDFLTIIKEHCRQAGFLCFAIDNVETALEAVHHINPDLIILDLNFRNGFDGTSFLTCQKIKGGEFCFQPPIIILSSLDNTETVDYVMNLGAKGYMSKPFDPRMLVAMIRDYLGEVDKESYDSDVTDFGFSLQ